MGLALAEAERTALLRTCESLQRALYWPRVPLVYLCPQCRVLEVVPDADVTVHDTPDELCEPHAVEHAEAGAEAAWERMTATERVEHDVDWCR